MSNRLFVPLCAALVATPALAGVVGGSGTIDRMETAAGYIDLDTGGEFIADLIGVDAPPVGSFIFLGGGIPGVEMFFGELEFASTAGPVARFESMNSLEVDPFAFPENEWAFAGNRIIFSSTVAVEVFMLVDLNVEGGGLGFLEIYGDAAPPFLNPVGGTWGVSFTLAAGTHTIAWGAMSSPAGGTAEMDGFLTLTLVPAPGAMALLAVAGLITGQRRRR